MIGKKPLQIIKSRKVRQSSSLRFKRNRTQSSPIPNHSSIYFRNHFPLWTTAKLNSSLSEANDKISKIFGYDFETRFLKEELTNLDSGLLVSKLELLIYEYRFLRYNHFSGFRNVCVEWAEETVKNFNLSKKVLKLCIEMFDKMSSNLDLLLIQAFIVHQFSQFLQSGSVSYNEHNFEELLLSFLKSFKLKRKHLKLINLKLSSRKESIMCLNTCLLLSVKLLEPQKNSALCKVRQVSSFVEMERLTDCQAFYDRFNICCSKASKSFFVPEIKDLEKKVLEIVNFKVSEVSK